VARSIEPIRVEGLRDLQAALKAIDGESQKQLRVVLNDAAGVVVRGGQRRAPVKTGAYRASLKVSSSQREARVKSGSAKVQYAGWLDYGGAVGRKHATKRPFVKTGRVVYPAYYAQQANILAMLNAGLIRLVKASGLEVTP
jgi:hypothetical protein